LAQRSYTAVRSAEEIRGKLRGRITLRQEVMLGGEKRPLEAVWTRELGAQG
jgi:hypothetical protein